MNIPIDFNQPIPPTKKQMEFIREIEYYVTDYFEGTTMEEASQYISDHIEEYHQRKWEDNYGS